MNNQKRMPPEREAITKKFCINGVDESYKGYITVGLYPDGTLGEIFIKMDRQGSKVSGFIDAWAIAVSMLLQTGTSVEEICNKFRGMQFRPSGMTGDPEIPFARSPIDFIIRWLEIKFIKKESEASEAPGDAAVS